MTVSRHDLMDEVLARIDNLGFEMGPGFATHAPMGAEALFTLGHQEEAVLWIDRYVRKVPHHPRPAPTSRIDRRAEPDWRNARGDKRRLADWAVLFEEELAEAPWTDVLALWWPRLVPGCIGGLTHGLIRTAHAVRSLAGDPNPTPRMRRELSEGLAYWAAVYAPLPGQPDPQGTRSAQQAIAAIPAAEPRDVFGAAAGRRQPGARGEDGEMLPGFDEAINELAAPPDVDQALQALTREFANLLRYRTAANPVAAVHTVTAPAAARMMLAHLPVETHRQTYA